jgi:hypothetical protein
MLNILFGLRLRSELRMRKFGELLSEAMDDTIRQVFGEHASEMIYRVMERHAFLKREEIGDKIELFCAYLEKLLGSEGAQVIQATSLKRLCLKLRLEYEEVEMYFSFLDKLYEVKFKLLAQSLKEERSVCN